MTVIDYPVGGSMIHETATEETHATKTLAPTLCSGVRGAIHERGNLSQMLAAERPPGLEHRVSRPPYKNTNNNKY